MRTTALISALLLLAGGTVRAEVENLDRFLRSVEQAAQVTTPLRGDGQFDVAGIDRTRRDQVVVMVLPPTNTYIELQQEGIKALLLNQAAQAYRVTPGGHAAQKFPLDASFAGSDFTREDLMPFRLADYQQPRISDESASDITVTLFPTTPQYSLVVITFDRDKKVPRKTLYYRETLNNLVKMRRDDDYVLVGRKWMATRISMETFKLRTHTTLSVRWTQETHVPPQLLDPAFLPRPSGIIWPTAPATPVPQ
jgi:hypothetical protein